MTSLKAQLDARDWLNHQIERDAKERKWRENEKKQKKARSTDTQVCPCNLISRKTLETGPAGTWVPWWKRWHLEKRCAGRPNGWLGVPDPRKERCDKYLSLDSREPFGLEGDFLFGEEVSEASDRA